MGWSWQKYWFVERFLLFSATLSFTIFHKSTKVCHSKLKNWNSEHKTGGCGRQESLGEAVELCFALRNLISYWKHLQSRNRIQKYFNTPWPPKDNLYLVFRCLITLQRFLGQEITPLRDEKCVNSQSKNMRKNRRNKKICHHVHSHSFSSLRIVLHYSSMKNFLPISGCEAVCLQRLSPRSASNMHAPPLY